ncbi:Precorrin-8X methylmutase CbiC/CobH [Syntrophobotulus glycolicus DSM 8271]|uniref:Precorrin-8X methylmutase CbiC/CobH n=1 Tax=Syntrophobotulus glycolicus (strain DSM 8271 / FlGlyR) TaxID=645991 RepID=F0SZ30_SYNGF|nr:precorrin-8X methylmutase [Syntrophobotulus glycolicus]ADY57148.1 Precorrin-8X methylmutase CbiC/CobH [Syntrophobotulus glycolicus DSM 8271]
MFEQLTPEEIEKRSFEIITRELEDTELAPDHADIIKRVIHTTADFDYVHNLYFSDGVVSKALRAIQNGVSIVTDTRMARAGINARSLARFGGEVFCFMADEDVALRAKTEKTTRAAVCMEKAVSLNRPLIFAIGNAPTALIKLQALIERKAVRPELVIAVPVGFVNVVESKELMMRTDVPLIVARGRKGGSNVAAAICNALIYKLGKPEK